MKQWVKLVVATTFVTVAVVVTTERSVVAQPDWIDDCGGSDGLCGILVQCSRESGDCDVDFYGHPEA